MVTVLTKSLARTIELIRNRYFRSRLNVISSLPANSMGVEVKKFGHTTAFSVQSIPGPSFNTIKGIIDEDINQIDRIKALYKQKKIPVQFELTPAHVSSDLCVILLKWLSANLIFIRHCIGKHQG